MIRPITLALLLLLSTVSGFSGEEIPGAPQKQTIALTNATVHTAAGPTLQKATVVFSNGVITDVGSGVTAPAGARVIDCKGAHVYPGFISPGASLGLVEIDAVRSTRDVNEVGSINPNAKAATAYNPDSDVIPTVRSNGVLLANIMPGGGLVSGTSALMRLDGWTREDIAVNPASGLVVNWPSMDVINAWWMRKSAEEQRKESAEAVRQLYDIFHEARAYSSASLAGADTSKKDIRMEAFRRVFEKRMPVIVNASSLLQIRSVIDFKNTFGVEVILFGAEDADLAIAELQKNDIKVVINRVHSLPRRDEDPYDRPFTLPATLAAAGVQFAFSDAGSWQQRNLPFQAGTARAFGLQEDAAIKALTLWPAQMFGIDSTYGSIEKGKSATLFVSTGDALDGLQNNVVAAFIDGREIDLSNRHKKLARKYRERTKQ